MESTVESIRSLAKERRDRRPTFALCRTQEYKEIINSHQLEIRTLANLSSLTVITEIEADLFGYADTVVNENLSVYLELQGINSEDAKLGKKKIHELKKQIEGLEKRMKDPGYKENALQQIQSENEKLDSLKKRLMLKEN